MFSRVRDELTRTRSVVVVANPALTSSTISSIVMPLTVSTRSVRPFGDAASMMSARQPSALGIVGDLILFQSMFLTQLPQVASFGSDNPTCGIKWAKLSRQW